MRKTRMKMLMFGTDDDYGTLMMMIVMLMIKTMSNIQPKLVFRLCPLQVLFELARFHAPSTIFLDELESLMSQRGTGGGG